MNKIKIFSLCFMLLFTVSHQIVSQSQEIRSKKNQNSKNANLLLSSSTSKFSFGEIYSNCDVGILFIGISKIIDTDINIKMVNVTFSSFCLWPPDPESNSFTAIVRVEDKVILNETVILMIVRNYTFSEEVDAHGKAGDLIKVNLTCPDGAAQSLFLGLKNWVPSLRCDIAYRENTTSYIPPGNGDDDSANRNGEAYDPTLLIWIPLIATFIGGGVIALIVTYRFKKRNIKKIPSNVE
ncbi:MAG: hypothetical protein GF383_05375 [Candidatus Lokiarchaeota archaeon]|nr:hypothetical protein [Candidatus Lokiarchaeota archaeon]MBD3339327.1 hypothetical protein [Candidatus Lokiarchaeota archaeon]